MKRIHIHSPRKDNLFSKPIAGGEDPGRKAADFKYEECGDTCDRECYGEDYPFLVSFVTMLSATLVPKRFAVKIRRKLWESAGFRAGQCRFRMNKEKYDECSVPIYRQAAEMM